MNRSRQRWTALCVFILVLSTFAPLIAQRPGRQSPVLRIYLARHGQTDWNVEGRTQGGRDIPLNATGRQQAERLKMRLAGIQFDAAYMSALSRSRQTAEIVHGQVPLTALPALGERRFGKFEGQLTKDPQSGPEFDRRIWIPDDSLDGGESLVTFRDRVRGALDVIRKAHESGSILVVGHSYTNRMILSVIFGLSTEQMRMFEQANDELYLIELQSGSPPRLWKQITEMNLGDL